VDILSNTISAPYINNTLLPMASYANEYYNYPPGGSPVRPSEPNYVWLEGGSIVYPDRTFTTNDPPSAVNSTGVTDHIVSLLNAKGYDWKSYQEGISGTDCPLVNVGGSSGYQPKHNPMIFFRDVTNNNDPNSAYCIQHVRPLTELFTDLASNTVGQYNFITPNQCNSMHDFCSPDRIKQGDTWLSNTIPLIMQSRAYSDGGAILITFDENQSPRTDSIAMIVLSKLGKGGGYSNRIRYDHSSTVRTIQRIFGLQPYLRDAISATDLSDLFLPGVFALPVTGLTLTGDPVARVNAATAFTATVSPLSATLPFTYVWQAAEQAPVTHTNGALTDTVQFTWTTTGTKPVTVTAINAAGAFSTAIVVTVTAPITGVAITADPVSRVNAATTFSATLSPVSATVPVTYVWQATAQSAVTRTNRGLTDTIPFTWTTTGMKAVTVTAVNASGAVTASTAVTVTSRSTTIPLVQMTRPRG
jgi:acid phosphatase